MAESVAIEFALPDGSGPTYADVGSDDTVDSDAAVDVSTIDQERTVEVALDVQSDRGHVDRGLVATDSLTTTSTTSTTSSTPVTDTGGTGPDTTTEPITTVNPATSVTDPSTTSEPSTPTETATPATVTTVAVQPVTTTDPSPAPRSAAPGQRAVPLDDVVAEHVGGHVCDKDHRRRRRAGVHR